MDYLQYCFQKVCYTCGLSEVDAGVDSPRKVIAYGNILLDHAFELKDQRLLERHGLALGSKGELDSEHIGQIINEASAECAEPILNLGGSALNTVGILKQLGTEALFFSAVGADDYAGMLRGMLNERGIETRLQTIENACTGLCLCLLHNGNPTLYANIGASAKFNVDYLRNQQLVLRLPNRKQIHYIEGYFLPQRLEVCEYVLNNFICERRRLAFNLSAPYIVRENFELLLKFAQHAYFLFGNLEEYAELCTQMKCENLQQMAAQLIRNGQVKIIVVTNGADGVELITNYVDEFTATEAPIFQDYKTSRVEHVIDETGAGDAFVAGFLNAWLEKRALSECLRLACDIAAKVVTQIGCNLPPQ